ncbi:MAG: hypothetical protein HLUCCX10_03300 [Algoriphagus marincola HL-49]|uniref:Porin n=1 Tax=Algoriphagus marincola HL-49 TaxID=1305737 RepID=A0A0P7YEB8_9BACT|nr:MAG: hypothetical protein HLUCCX10_03300 [Algoriphagus marincola HL-49]
MNCKYIVAFLLAGGLLLNNIQAQVPSLPRMERDSTDQIPGAGFSLAETENGTLNFSFYTTSRYLNQKGLNESYTDSFGRSFDLKPRNDYQFQKIVLYFKGWLFDPKFRYIGYIWTANTNIGLGAQVIGAGNLQYQVNKHLDLGLGIGGLTSTRSLLGQWPQWNRVDTRPMADEFFRASYTSGFWAQGEITKGLFYKTMIGNNLNQLGIDAGQLDDGFDTWSGSIWWTSNDYGRLASYGDFENHQKLATILGGLFTRSNETAQSQAGTEDPENSQIRLSDGTNIFGKNAFGEGIQLESAKFEMFSLMTGVKYKGFSLDFDYYMRWISKMQFDTDMAPVEDLFDQGFSIQASAMLVEKTFQAFGTYSYVDGGRYGDPSEWVLGVNWYVLKSRVLRVSPELIFTDRSPVGYLSYPTLIGASGPILSVNLELFY